MEIDSLYQLEKLKVHYYSKITGIQANSYELLQEIYDNKQAIEKAIGAEKEMQIKDLKKKNRKLILQNVGLTVGVAVLTFITIYFALL
jgi:translation initiation factor 2 gamma subunit (eIF-2gamma)